MNTKAIGYIRVSTKEQGDSLDAQQRKIKDYCTHRGLDLVELVCDEGESGGKSILKRKAGATITAHTEAGVNNIVAVKLDRMFRNTVDALVQIQDWTEKKIALHLLDFGGEELNTSTPQGRLMLTMVAAFAEMELDTIRQRTRDGLDNKRKKGECIGTVPWGFKRVGNKLVEMPYRQEALKNILDMAEAKMSWRHIAKSIEHEYGVKISHVTAQKLAESE